MTDPAWDPARWRDSHIQNKHTHDGLHTPNLAAPTAITPASRNATFYHFTPEVSPYDSRLQTTIGQIPTPTTEPHAALSAYTVEKGRRSPHSSGKCSPQRTAKTIGAWRGLQDDISRSRTSTAHIAEAPLTLHIPKPHGTSNIACTDRPIVAR